MVSIIKNQLLKHLSRYCKNLSADKINLSTFKGEGQLDNLELDEVVLTDLLELPSWLRLTSAWCNKVTFRIQWTKLKTVPIFLRLDQVHIEVETCQDLRSPSAPQAPGLPQAGTAKYSFIHKTIDGITVAVDNVSVTFKSPAFVASVQISKILVESKSPSWQRCDLRMTRVKDAERGQLLIFKELEWQTVRMEARSTRDEDLTPLRLLTNHARCRITIKKRLSDCLIMGSRLVLILDDLLWVLTDSQLKAALCFADSLGGLVKKATIAERRTKAARKLEVLPEYQAQISQQQARSKPQSTSLVSKMFMRYDVVETSYHFLSQRIDLHLCDDPGVGRSAHPDLKDGGAVQVSLVKFQIDYYPYHLAIADRKHWPKYRENATPHAQWLQQSVNHFRTQFMDFIDRGRSPVKKEDCRTEAETRRSSSVETQIQQPASTPEGKKTGQASSGNPVKTYVLEQLAKLMTTCMVIKIDDFTIFKVTSSTRKPQTREFIAGDRDRFCLPEDVTILHAEFTYYYYPGDMTFPLPPPKFYVQLNPLRVNYDLCSCLWFNCFGLNLYETLIIEQEKAAGRLPSNFIYFDVKLEAILPRIVFETQQDYPNQRDRPKSLHVQTSRVSLTNIRSSEKSSRADLAECLEAFRNADMFLGNEFPNKRDDYRTITDKFLDHCAGNDNARTYPKNVTCNTINELIKEANRELLWIESKDVWCCSFEPIWGDFFGIRAVGSSRPVAFFDAFPLSIWLHLTESGGPETGKKEPEMADIQALAHVTNLVSVQLNHYQYLFILRLSELVTEMAAYLVLDSARISGEKSAGSMAIGILLPQIEMTFITPSQTPGKESSGGDLESVIPDSSSIAEDFGHHLTSSHPPFQPISTHQPTINRVDFSGPFRDRIGTGNDVETPQSEIASILSMDCQFPAGISGNTGAPSVSFKEEDFSKKSPGPTFFPGNSEKNAVFEGGKNLNLKNFPAKNFFEENSNFTATQQQQAFIPNNFNVGLSSMKKGFANLMTSIDSALKASPEDACSDTVSVRSDISSDSENYIVASLEEQDACDALFGALNSGPAACAVEEAREVVEETPDTQSEKSIDSSCKRKDLVSMITFKLSKMEIIQQSCGFESSIKAQISNVASEECSTIPWDEFQTKFGSRSRGWVELGPSGQTRSRIKLRLDHGPRKKGDRGQAFPADVHDREALLGAFEDRLEIRVSDVPLTLSMSSVTGLADLSEDEIIPKPVPLELLLENITLRLNEDRPPSNITSPGPVPIDLCISRLRISRDAAGIFRIEPAACETASNSTLNGDESEELEKLRRKNTNLEGENEELRRRIASLERSSDHATRIRLGGKDESEALRSRLSGAQENISALLEEKLALERTVADLRDEVIRSNEPANTNRSLWSIKR